MNIKIALRYKFTGIVLLTALPFLIYGAVNFLHAVHENKRNAVSKNLAVAQETAENIEDFIQSTQNILYALATHPDIVNKDSAGTDEIFRQILPLYKTYENVIAADMKGNNFGSGIESSLARRLNYLDRDWFNRSNSGTAYISNLYISKLLQHPVFMITMPVFDPSGTQQAVIGLPVNLSKLQDQLLEIERLETNGYFCIIDNNGKILIDSMNAKNIGSNFKPQELLQKILEHQVGSLTGFTHEGTEFWFSYATISSTGWKVIAGQPLQDLYATANRAAMHHLLFFMLLSSIALFTSLLYSKKIGKNVELIINGLNEVASGNLNHTVSIKGTDELAIAGTAFNKMIAERKNAEDEIKLLAGSLEQRVAERTSELEQAKTELEAFSYTVSHDLQAPARHVIAFSEILLNDHAESLSADIRNLMYRIRRAGENMQDMVVHLLALSNINRKHLNRMNIDFSALCKNIFNEMRDTMPESSATATIEEGLLINADPVLLEIAIRNLLENAWKYSSGCTLPHIEAGRTERNGKDCFFIRDNGCGFDMDYVEKIFFPFHKLHPETEYAGSGVGLATVHRIMLRHGGFVAAHGTPGQGAVFYFNTANC